MKNNITNLKSTELNQDQLIQISNLFYKSFKIDVTPEKLYKKIHK